MGKRKSWHRITEEEFSHHKELQRMGMSQVKVGRIMSRSAGTMSKIFAADTLEDYLRIVNSYSRGAEPQGDADGETTLSSTEVVHYTPAKRQEPPINFDRAELRAWSMLVGRQLGNGVEARDAMQIADDVIVEYRERA